MFTVEGGVPLPPERLRKYPFKEMEPGDSIFFEDGRRAGSARVAAARFAAAQAPVWVFTLRKTDAGNDKRGWRLWRLS